MDAPTNIHGRGTGLNPANRFERIHVAPDPEYFDPDEPPPPTEILWDDSQSIIVRHKSPDIPFDASINIYRGCEHGCAYCYARPYHEYLGMSAGLDFETKIVAKRNAAKLLRAAFMKPSWKPGMVALSGTTDVYQPLESKLRLTRAVIEVFAEFRNPLGMITKNALILRDLDLLAELARHDAVSVTLSVTTLDEDLRRKLEPRTSTIAKRLHAIEQLSRAGVPVGVNVAPIIPGLTDHEVPELLKRAREAGATRAGMTILRLPYAVAEIFEQWLITHVPDRRDKVMGRLREIHGGRLSTSTFGQRMRGTGQWAENITALFELNRRRLGFNRERRPISTAAFRRPGDTRAMF